MWIIEYGAERERGKGLRVPGIKKEAARQSNLSVRPRFKSPRLLTFSRLSACRSRSAKSWEIRGFGPGWIPLKELVSSVLGTHICSLSILSWFCSLWGIVTISFLPMLMSCAFTISDPSPWANAQLCFAHLDSDSFLLWDLWLLRVRTGACPLGPLTICLLTYPI